MKRNQSNRTDAIESIRPHAIEALDNGEKFLNAIRFDASFSTDALIRAVKVFEVSRRFERLVNEAIRVSYILDNQSERE